MRTHVSGRIPHDVLVFTLHRYNYADRSGLRKHSNRCFRIGSCYNRDGSAAGQAAIRKIGRFSEEMVFYHCICATRYGESSFVLSGPLLN